ncbi:hypothetical protein ACFFMR_20790 [Micromonospora andamanensis]|uniref:PASTA domain-containing protein n=1 Tax=Micromonospora andamanensis TaxID=1287068 RepID=A0ABQ4HV64_9ACTN|nr:hypothetical protein [Micromonospora andamanensis]GIJ09525.1 hypothetical protein Van01_27390 [Micromonospora andamanensis]
MRRNRALLVSAIALIALSACGSPSSGGKNEQGDTAEVATLRTPEAERSGSASPKAERPRERLDTTAEEYQALLGPYHTCMRDHGVDPSKHRRIGLPPGTAGSKEEQEADAANRICEPQFYPLPPWERDPANPEARDFALDVVKCLRDKGVKYVEVAEDGVSISFGGDRNDSRSISLGLDLAPECERKVAAESN